VFDKKLLGLAFTNQLVCKFANGSDFCLTILIPLTGGLFPWHKSNEALIHGAGQRKSGDTRLTRLEEFLAGERDFDEAMAVDEYVVAVTVDAVIVDEEGRRHGVGC